MMSITEKPQRTPEEQAAIVENMRRMIGEQCDRECHEAALARQRRNMEERAANNQESVEPNHFDYTEWQRGLWNDLTLEQVHQLAVDREKAKMKGNETEQQ
jgi:hypothetical protein